MAPISSNVSLHRVPGRLAARINRAIERWVPVACIGVVLLAFMVEVVRTASPDAPVVESTFDVAPAT